MSEKEKKGQRLYDLLNADTKPKKITETTGDFFMASIKPWR